MDGQQLVVLVSVHGKVPESVQVLSPATAWLSLRARLPGTLVNNYKNDISVERYAGPVFFPFTTFEESLLTFDFF